MRVEARLIVFQLHLWKLSPVLELQEDRGTQLSQFCIRPTFDCKNGIGEACFFIYYFFSLFKNPPLQCCSLLMCIMRFIDCKHMSHCVWIAGREVIGRAEKRDRPYSYIFPYPIPCLRRINPVPLSYLVDHRFNPFIFNFIRHDG